MFASQGELAFIFLQWFRFELVITTMLLLPPLQKLKEKAHQETFIYPTIIGHIPCKSSLHAFSQELCSLRTSVRVVSKTDIVPAFVDLVCWWKLLLLLLSRFSHVRLCATPEVAAHQAPPSLGFSRQEHWSGLPFPSPANTVY